MRPDALPEMTISMVFSNTYLASPNLPRRTSNLGSRSQSVSYIQIAPFDVKKHVSQHEVQTGGKVESFPMPARDATVTFL